MAGDRMDKHRGGVAKFRDNFLAARGGNTRFHQSDIARVKSDDRWLLAFLAAEEGDVDAAGERLANTMLWRSEIGINDLSKFQAGIRQDVLRHGSVFSRHRDLKGRRILWLIPCRGDEMKLRLLEVNVCKDGVLSQLQNNGLLVVEKGLRQGSSLSEQVTVIMDLTGAPWFADVIDMQMLKWMIHTASTNYPNTIENLLIVNLPAVVAALARFLLGFMHKDTREAVTFADLPTLKEFVDPSCLPEHLGGTDVGWEQGFEGFEECQLHVVADS